MAAGNRHGPALLQGQPSHQGDPDAGIGVGFIDVEVHATATALGQFKQGQQRLPIADAAGQPLAIGGADHPAQQPLAVRHPAGQGNAVGAEPVVHRCHRHQLQLHPAKPALAGFQQGIPAGLGRRPQAVNVAADGPQTIAPGPIQGPLGPLGHLLGRALAVFAQVGLHGRGHGALAVGKGDGAEGLIEVGMGLHQGRERQRQPGGRRGRRGRQGFDRRDLASCYPEPQRHQAIGIGPKAHRQPWIQQAAGQAHQQRAGPSSRVHGPSWELSLLAAISTNWPATASTVERKRGTCQASTVWPPTSLR